MEDKLHQTLGVSLRGFDILPTDKAAWVEHHPDLVLDVLVADVKVTVGSEVTLFSSEGQPLVIRNRQMCFAAFDVGTLYEKLPTEKRTELAEILRIRLLE